MFTFDGNRFSVNIQYPTRLVVLTENETKIEIPFVSRVVERVAKMPFGEKEFGNRMKPNCHFRLDGNILHIRNCDTNEKIIVEWSRLQKFFNYVEFNKSRIARFERDFR